MQKLEIEFWKLVKAKQKLDKLRMKSLKVWDLPEIIRLETLIDDNNKESDLIIDEMRNNYTNSLKRAI